jgi:hypothetical protein
MLDDNQKVSFWTTLPGILTGIAAVLGSILAIIQVFNHPTIPTDKESQRIEVDSTSEQGTPFKNPESKPIKVNFQADGQWSIIPTNVSENDLPKGNISPDGAGDFSANPNKLCPGFALGALVIRGQQGKCITSGAHGTFDLRSGETVYFVANDVKNLYHDNNGSISVNLSIVK